MINDGLGSIALRGGVVPVLPRVFKCLIPFGLLQNNRVVVICDIRISAIKGIKNESAPGSDPPCFFLRIAIVHDHMNLFGISQSPPENRHKAVIFPFVFLDLRVCKIAASPTSLACYFGIFVNRTFKRTVIIVINAQV